MVHQKLTKKQDYINSLKTILSQIEVNGEDEAVQEWSRRMTQGDGSSDTYIPSFHLENNVRKWGELKVEVHFCPYSFVFSSTDAYFMCRILRSLEP